MRTLLFIIILMILPLHVLAQELAQPSEQVVSDNGAGDDQFINGIMDYNEYSKVYEYSYCSAWPHDCKRVSGKYKLKKRCLLDSSHCDCYHDGHIESCSKAFILSRSNQGVDETITIGDSLNAKVTKPKKKRYSTQTKPQTIKVMLKKSIKKTKQRKDYSEIYYEEVLDKKTTEDVLMREVCAVKQNTDKVSQSCECYLIKDHCGNYINNKAELVYDTKYLDTDGKLLTDKLEEDGCYVVEHIGKRIKCSRQEFDYILRSK